jgi:hypothetical protein
VAAPASGDLRLFLSATGPGAAPDRENPEIVCGSPDQPVKLYLWAEMLGLGASWPTVIEHWHMVSYNVRASGASDPLLVAYNLLNPTIGGVDRWQVTGYGGDPMPTNEARDFRMAYVTSGFGVTNDWNGRASGTEDPHYATDGVHEYVCLGDFDFQCQGLGWSDIYLGVGLGGIVRQGCSYAEPVFMGFGDEDAGLMGNSFNQYSYLCDARINCIPAPASVGLGLLGLSALALLRR